MASLIAEDQPLIGIPLLASEPSDLASLQALGSMFVSLLDEAVRFLEPSVVRPGLACRTAVIPLTVLPHCGINDVSREWCIPDKQGSQPFWSWRGQ